MAKIETVKNKKHEVIHPITETQAVEGLAEELAKKQETLVSGENIKKINGESILGNGNIIITGEGTTITIDKHLSPTSENPVENKAVTEALGTKQDNLESGVNIKMINGESIVGQGNLHIQEGDPSAVKFAIQELTEEQQAQARRNINAASLADLEDTKFVTAAELPEASGETMGYIFLIGPGRNSTYDRYFTQQSGEESYEWIPLGPTQIDLTTYASKSSVSELAARLDTLAFTKYYGIFASAELLPATAGDKGYAYVGSGDPFSIFEFDGVEWINTEATVSGIQGEPGVGFESAVTPVNADGTLIITLSNGDTLTLDLNHGHPDYWTKVVGTEIPSGGLLPDVVYHLGILSGSITFTLAPAVAGNTNHYFWTFSTGEVAPSVSWPAGITWASGSVQSIAASAHYEVSILDNIAICLEV